MNDPSDPDLGTRRAPATVPVHVDVTVVDGRRRLQGWVACSERGPIDFEDCSVCDHCRDVVGDGERRLAVLCDHPRQRGGRPGA